EREDVVAVTAAMLRPVGLHPFANAFPDRVFDVGIAEQHAVTSAAGIATAGLHPVVCVYATLLNRAFDQVLVDVALHRLPVTFVLDRAGVTGDGGASHNGMWAVALPVTVVDPRWVLPVDASLPALAAAHTLVVVIEDTGRAGGVGDAVARELRARRVDVEVATFALPQEFLETGKRAAVLASAGLS